MVTLLRRPQSRVLILTAISLGTLGLTALLTARWLGPADRGVLVIAISMSSVTTLIGAAGLTSTLRTLFAHADHRLTVEAFAPLGARLLLSAGVPLAALGAIGVGIVSGTRNPALLATTTAFAIAALGAALGRETLHGLGHHAAAVASDLFPPLLQLVGSTLLWRAGHLSVTSVLALGALGYAGQICFCLWKSGFAWSRREATSWGQLRGLIIISLPAMLAGVGNIVMWKGDRLILGAVSTNAEVGIYGTAASLADLAWIVPSAASAILIRRVASVGNLSSLSHWRRRYVSITAVLAIGAAGISFLVMHYVLGGEFVRGLPAAYLLCGASVLLASSNIDLSACQGLGDFRSGSIVTSTGACAMVIAAIPLSYLYGATGCASASVVAYVVTAIFARQRVQAHARPLPQDLVGRGLEV